MESDIGGGAAAAAAPTTVIEPSGCYGGGDIAGAVIGSLIGGIVLAYLLYRLYVHYWRNRKGKHLVQEDPENAKQEFAFDNPAFRNEKQKTAANSPLETKWTFNKKTPDKRQTVDDSQAGSAVTRSVSLRGSDFTGLGIEICGGLKDGIYVRKVMPQGPAAQTVRCGDRIVSITIDLQHMVQEDAATILSYASPYNVQLELIDGTGTLPRQLAAQSPAAHNASGSSNTTASSSAQQHHPLYRASSQDDVATIERNARRKLFVTSQQQQQQQDEISNYPTLKLEAPVAVGDNAGPVSAATSSPTTTTTTTTVHRENETLQQRANTATPAPNPIVTSTNHIEVISVVQQPEKIIMPPTEVIVVTTPPPIINKRTKHLTKHPDSEPTKTEESCAAVTDESPATPLQAVVQEVNETTTHLQRMNSINSSGIRRDAAGIPQEIPEQMFAAAMAARGNRKSTGPTVLAAAVEDAATDDAIDVLTTTVVEDEANKNRTKAPPRPPARGDSLVAESSNEIKSLPSSPTVSVSVDASDVTTIDIDGSGGIALKTTDFADVVLEDQQRNVVGSNDDSANHSGAISIELNSRHITVHHSSSAADVEAPIPNKRTHHHHQHHQQSQPQQPQQLHHEIRIADNTDQHQHQQLQQQQQQQSPPAPVPRSSIISLESSLVEQVLAVADGFTQETRATLSRQLSELNEDHVPTIVSSRSDNHNDVADSDTESADGTSTMNHRNSGGGVDVLDIGTEAEILNNYKFKAEPVLLSMSSSQYPFDDGSLSGSASSAMIANNTASNGLEQTTPPLNGHHHHLNDDDHHHVTLSYGINIPDDAKASRYPFAGSPQQLSSSLTGDQPAAIVPVFSSDGHGVNSISITSMDISADEMEHIVSQPSSIIAIDDEDLDFALQSPSATPTLSNGNGKPLNGGISNDVFIIESLSSMKTAAMVQQPEEEAAHNADKSTENGVHSTSSFVTENQLTPTAISAASNNSSPTPTTVPTASPKITTSPATRRNSHNNGTSSSSTPSTPSPTTSKLPPPSPPRPKQRTSPPSASQPADRIPRNTEMKFTTATYAESATQRHLNAAKLQAPVEQIEQIRSTFERGHTQSEIPVLVRRPSIPASPPANFSGGGTHSQSTSSLSSLPRTSPSKIPVFNSSSPAAAASKSTATADRSGGGGGYSSSGTGGSSTGHSPPVQARTNGNGFLYRSHSSLNASATSSRSNSLNGSGSGVVVGAGGVVTVSAIKNSSRNPSGK